ncbi:uncharacterized protein RBU47_013152 [Passerculus sandwichensis]
MMDFDSGAFFKARLHRHGLGAAFLSAVAGVSRALRVLRLLWALPGLCWAQPWAQLGWLCPHIALTALHQTSPLRAQRLSFVLWQQCHEWAKAGEWAVLLRQCSLELMDGELPFCTSKPEEKAKTCPTKGMSFAPGSRVEQLPSCWLSCLGRARQPLAQQG